jgi:hypothetical protein
VSLPGRVTGNPVLCRIFRLKATVADYAPRM